jgi:alanine dehydrogenase
MIIGVPKEIKKNEFRIAVTPDGVRAFIRKGHKVYVEHSAGIGSGYDDEDYAKAGAVVTDVKEVYECSEMIYKVKEILPSEYQYMREELIVFTYLHSNAYLEMTQELMKKKIIGIAYEDVIDDKGQFPLLKPMSDLAGKGGFIAGLNYLQSINGGKGTLLARVNGVRTPQVTIIGAGAAGLGAAELAVGFGNKVCILDIDIDRLEEIKQKFTPNVEFLYSNRENLEYCIKNSDIVINCILWDKTRKDHLINKEDLKLFKPRSVIVDVSCDENGAIETSHSTSHNNPIYEVDGIIHYAVDNIPSTFANTATIALSNVTLPYALEIANKGVERTLSENKGLRRGLSFYKGNLTLEETAIKHNIPYVKPEAILKLV